MPGAADDSVAAPESTSLGIICPSSFSHLCAYSHGSPLSRAVNNRYRTQHPGHAVPVLIVCSPLLSACWRDPVPIKEDDATARHWPEGGAELHRHLCKSGPALYDMAAPQLKHAVSKPTGTDMYRSLNVRAIMVASCATLCN